MVNGDLSHSTWLAPQLDELSLSQEPCSISGISHNANAHIPATDTQSCQGVGGSVIRSHIALLTLNKNDVRGKETCKHFVPLMFSTSAVGRIIKAINSIKNNVFLWSCFKISLSVCIVFCIVECNDFPKSSVCRIQRLSGLLENISKGKVTAQFDSRAIFHDTVYHRTRLSELCELWCFCLPSNQMLAPSLTSFYL